MLIWKKDSPYPAPVSPNSCYSPARAEDKVHIAEFCRKLGIPYTVLDCSDLYESTVLENFRSEYMSARYGAMRRSNSVSFLSMPERRGLNLTNSQPVIMHA